MKNAKEKVYNELVDNVASISSIKTVSKDKVFRKIDQFRNLRRNHLRNLSIDSRNGKPRVQNIKKNKGKKGPNFTSFSELEKRIFDVYVTSSMSETDLEFYQDQCGPRKMRRLPSIYMQPSGDTGNVDDTSVDDQIVDPEAEVEASPEVSSEEIESEGEDQAPEVTLEEESEVDDESDIDFCLPETSSKTTGKKTVPKEFIEHCERFNISNKAAAGFLTMQLPGSLSYTKSGIQKNRQKRRKDESCPDFSDTKVHTIGLDEKIDTINPIRVPGGGGYRL